MLTRAGAGILFFLLCLLGSNRAAGKNYVGDPPPGPASGPQEICGLVNAIDHDYEHLLRAQWARLAAAGFRTIELGAYTKPFSPSLAQIWSDLEFGTLASGGSLHEMEGNLDAMIANARALKQKYLVCYWPWLDGGKHLTEAQCRESAAIMNRLGARCRAAGLMFAFHNHALEFQELSGRTVMDRLLEYTDPALVSLELDVYHQLKGGGDPVSFMRAHGRRIRILHLNALDEQSAYPVVGDGMADFPAILRTSREIGVRYLVVEGQGLRDPLRYFEESFHRMKDLLEQIEAKQKPAQPAERGE